MFICSRFSLFNLLI